MRSSAVDEKALAAKAAQVKSDSKDLHGAWPVAEVPPALWGAMLDLMYGGHQDAAWQFLDAAWPAQVGGKARFKRDFSAQLKQSPYWKAIARAG